MHSEIINALSRVDLLVVDDSPEAIANILSLICGVGLPPPLLPPHLINRSGKMTLQSYFKVFTNPTWITESSETRTHLMVIPLTIGSGDNVNQLVNKYFCSDKMEFAFKSITSKVEGGYVCWRSKRLSTSGSISFQQYVDYLVNA